MQIRILGSVLALGLAISACSSDDDSASDSTSAGATTVPATTPATTAAPVDTTPVETAETTDPPTSTPEGSGLDDSFGESGILVTPSSATDDDRFITVHEGADGMIYASGFTSVGDDHLFAVARFSADGTPDATFGDGGVASINVMPDGGGAEVARGLVVQEDGKIVVAGPAETAPVVEDTPADLDVVVIRLEADGSLDATFGEGGIARFDLGAGKVIDDETYIADNAWGLTARDGGYAVMAVTPNQDADRTDVDYAIVGVTDDGALDAAFGTDGVVIADADASGDSARNITTQDDGQILGTGYSRDGDGVVSPVLIRMSADGVLDETFGNGGVANNVILEGVTESYQVVPQGDSYILAGYGRGADSEEKVDLVVYRFNADGSHDESFGTAGVTRLDLADEDDRARNLTILPDGNILAVGSGKLDADNVDAMVVLLDPDGALIESFGDAGHLLVDLGGPGDGFFGVTVTADGSSAYLAGFKGADPEGTENDDAVLARIAL